MDPTFPQLPTSVSKIYGFQQFLTSLTDELGIPETTEDVPIVPVPPQPTFNPFSRLPPELRLKIWSLYHDSCPPRKLHFSYRKPNFHYNKKGRILEGGFSFSYGGNDIKKSDIPTILHICSESRAFGLEQYSIGFSVLQSQELVQRDVHFAFEECSHEEAIGRKGQGLYWDRRKDVMWIDDNWLNDNLTAMSADGKFDVRCPGVKWLCFDKQTMVSFVTDRAVSWEGVETVFALRNMKTHDTSGYEAMERQGWEEKFRILNPFGKQIRDGTEGKELPELKFVGSWEEILEHLHQEGVW